MALLPPAPETARDTRTTLAPEALRKLLVWLSPAFPVGSYSYSHGLEWAIEDGSVYDAVTLCRLADGCLAPRGRPHDAILFLEVWRAADAGDCNRCEQLQRSPPPCSHHASAPGIDRPGPRLPRRVLAAWPHSRLNRLAAMFAPDEALPYPVAVAICA